jgi:hypothetical protein
MLESAFQHKLIGEIRDLFPGCVVLKNDPTYIQGFPDLTILYKDRWACLECKKDETASRRPNQEYYISKLDRMSFAKFIFPENKDEALNELTEYFQGGQYELCMGERLETRPLD